MESVPEVIETIQNTLEPYIKPRDQVAYVRRVLALHLDSCLENDQLKSPLSLVDASCSTTSSSDARGLQRDYLKALEANLKARREHENVRRQHVESDSKTPASFGSTADHVEDHIAFVKLQKKQQRLLVLQKYLDQLGEQPAASQDFLDLEAVLAGASPLPDVPSEVVNGFTVNTEAGKTDLKGLVGQLERVVLRAKLLLKREEELLEQVKSRAVEEPVSDAAKLQALNVTRTELINWIEGELGKAGPEAGEENGDDDQDGPENGHGARLKTQPSSVDVSNKLAHIKDKYTVYLEARKSLVTLVRQSAQPTLLPAVDSTEPTTESATQASTTATTTHLLTPYLEDLLALSREQKGMILQKSHFNITLAKQLKDTCQMLDHLAEESQLLPGFPASGAATARPKFGLIDDLASGAPEKPDSTARVRKWVSAADAAKIATLEAVAERIEEGQVALEGSMKALGEVDRLLGQQQHQQGGEDARLDEDEEQEGAKDDDIWLTAGPSKKGAGARRHVDKKKDKAKKPNDVWSVLEGNLGLIGHGDQA